MPTETTDLNPPTRILMGPGPSNVHPRVRQAMSAPLVGHLDPYFLEIMDETKAMLQELFQTSNELTIPISATGSAGMEACLCNLIEPGDEVLVCVNGVFGGRMCDIVERCGGLLVPVNAEMGKIIEPDQVANALDGSHPKIIALVHAETSTGVLQPLAQISQMAQERNVLLVVDTVTSLGGFPVQVDAWGIDAVYSGTQKCMSCPPGLSPISFSEKAVNALDARTKKVSSWYLDLTMVRQYWGEDRVYHHTAPINMIYALREALRVIHEEGLDPRFDRHRRNHEALVAGVEAMGLSMLVDEGHRLWMLNAVNVPEGVDEPQVRQTLLNDYNMEIGAGLGDLAGKIWRIGLMGESSTRNNVLLALAALEDALGQQGHPCDPGAGVEAAMKRYALEE